MAIFFTLSGFLIVKALVHDSRIIPFLIRRFYRIAPLAWLSMLTLFLASGIPANRLVANILFYANLPPFLLMPGGEHLWSLCVEVQFYVGIALFAAMAGRYFVYILPFACLGITAARLCAGVPISIVTWHRIDEILAGATLAALLIGGKLSGIFGRFPPYSVFILIPLLVASSSTETAILPYFRPYIASMLVGVSMFSVPKQFGDLLCSKYARYVASISYAVYVIHGMLAATWLGSGDKLHKYAKRPLLLALTVITAHYSTFRFEKPMIARGKSLIYRLYAK